MPDEPNTKADARGPAIYEIGSRGIWDVNGRTGSMA